MRRLVLSTCQVDLARREVHGRGEVCTLTPHEADLLAYLVERAPDPVSKAELLTEVWGYRPGVESSTVFNTMRRLREKVEGDPSSPEHLVTLRGTGYRFVPSGSVREARPDGPLGRDAELQQLPAALSEHRVVTLVGPGGIGKTTLARAVALDHPGPAWFVDVSEATDDTEVLAATARALGIAGPEPAAAVRRVLDEPGTLVVLDNIEDVAGPAAQRVQAWLDACPRLRVLATGRAPLRIAEEQEWAVAPLATAAGVDLLARAARRLVSDLDVEDPALAAIVEAVEGIPLAVELAAARLRVLSPATLLERLTRGLSTLTASRRDRPARHSTLEAVVSSSWESLDEADRVGLARASVFRGAFDLDAAEAVLGPDALDILESLVTRSLVRVERGDPVRYRLFRVIREVAAQRLDALGRTDETRERHVAHYVRASAGASTMWVRHHLDDMTEARRHATGTDLARLIAAMRVVRSETGPLARAVAELHEGLAATDDPAVRGLLWWGLAECHGRDGDDDACAEALDEADALAEAHALDDLRSRVANTRGLLARNRGRFEDALAHYRRALHQHEALGARRVVGSTLGRIGLVLSQLGRTDEAVATLERALAVHREVGNRANEANVRVNLVRLRGGRSDADIDELRAAAELAAEVGATRVEWSARHHLALALDEAGRADEAAPQRERLRSLKLRLGVAEEG